MGAILLKINNKFSFHWPLRCPRQHMHRVCCVSVLWKQKLMQLNKRTDKEPTEVALEDWGISLILCFTVPAYKAVCVCVQHQLRSVLTCIFLLSTCRPWEAETQGNRENQSLFCLVFMIELCVKPKVPYVISKRRKVQKFKTVKWTNRNRNQRGHF